MTEPVIDFIAARFPRGGRTRVMGVLNVTPDSFSDGGRFAAHDAALAQARAMIGEGADVIDIGGESSRPGHTPVDAAEEAVRVLPVIRDLVGDCAVPISIDSWKASVAAQAVEAGASVVNDVWGFQRDPDIARVTAANGAACVLMHNRADNIYAGDVVAEVCDFLGRSVDIALGAGVPEARIVLDPGIGFGKTSAHNLAILRRWDALKALGFPLLLGASRKRIVGRLLVGEDGVDRPLAGRGDGTLALKVWAATVHGVEFVRVHDVARHVDAMTVVARLSGRDAEWTA